MVLFFFLFNFLVFIIFEGVNSDWLIKSRRKHCVKPQNKDYNQKSDSLSAP